MILSAGAIGSPHILQLSGVGDPEHLGRIGVPVVHELRGVGRNMQDHYVARVSYPVVGTADRQRAVARPAARRRGHALAVHRQGHADLQPLARRRLGQGAGGIRRPPTCRVTFAPGSFKDGQIGELEETPGLSAGAWQMRPLSRGYVEAKSNRPGDMPAINPRYLSEETDRRAIIGGLAIRAADVRRAGAEAVRPARRACRQRRCRPTTSCSITRGATAAPCYHASCTCMMGPQAMSVVDSELRVHGIDGLRVIDASVMPAVTSTNTNAPTIMIAEKGAAMIKGAARQRLAA